MDENQGRVCNSWNGNITSCLIASLNAIETHMTEKTKMYDWNFILGLRNNRIITNVFGTYRTYKNIQENVQLAEKTHFLYPIKNRTAVLRLVAEIA